MSFAMTKDLSYHKFFKKTIIEMFQNGQMHKMMKKWEDQKIDCSPLVRTGVPLTFEKVVSLFMIVALGAISGLFVMLIEIEQYSSKNTKKKKISIQEIEDWTKLKSICNLVKSKIDMKEYPTKSELLMLEDLAQKLKPIK